MRLSQLDAQLYKYVGDQTFQPVATVADADSIMFLCPLCYEINGGAHGTHSIRVDFLGRGVPEDIAIRNAEDKAVWWQIMAGSTIEDLTCMPSIQLLSDCAWHGFIAAGGAELKPAPT